MVEGSVGVEWGFYVCGRFAKWGRLRIGHFSRPYGTQTHSISDPNAEALGYCRLSFWDRNGAVASNPGDWVLGGCETGLNGWKAAEYARTPDASRGLTAVNHGARRH